jgi:hypothetical protein
LMALVSIGTAGDPTPVVIPAEISGSGFTTSKFADGYVTRSASGDSYVTSRFGDGWITRGTNGKSWTTSRFGNGAITRGSGGTSVTTSTFGDGFKSSGDRSRTNRSARMRGGRRESRLVGELESSDG